MFQLGASLGVTDTTLTLADNGISQITAELPVPQLLLLKRASDGAVEVVRLLLPQSGTTGIISRGALGTTALAFTTADTASLMPAKSVSGILSYLAGSPAVADDDAVHAAVTLSGSPQTITFSYVPDTPRVPTIKGNAGGIAGNVVFNGIDIEGSVIQDTLAANGTSLVIGTKAFAAFTSIVYPAETHVGTDTIKAGTSNVLGMPVYVSRDSIVKAFFDGDPDTYTFTGGDTVSECTFEMNTTLDGSPVIIDYYIP